MWEERAGGVHTEHRPIEIYFSRSDRPSPSRLAVFVDDADAAYEKYRAAGAEIVDEPKSKAWGLRGFAVRDPDGNLIGIAHEVHNPLGRSEYRDLSAERARQPDYLPTGLHATMQTHGRTALVSEHFALPSATSIRGVVGHGTG